MVWVADLTYIRLPSSFVYLATILDAYSRKCVGWKLSKRIDTQLTLGALEAALVARDVKAGLIHHSARGVKSCQYRVCRTAAQHGGASQHGSFGQSLR